MFISWTAPKHAVHVIMMCNDSGKIGKTHPRAKGGRPIQQLIINILGRICMTKAQMVRNSHAGDFESYGDF